MKSTLTSQYNLVKQSREVLLRYCDTISGTDFTKENSSFGRGSVRNLLVHNGNTYELWIGRRALQRNMEFTRFASINSVDELRTFYREIDILMDDFFNRYGPDPETKVPIQLKDRQIRLTPLQLFTHVITHEFHHKGQVLSLSRHLGYTPVDTDIIR